MSKQDINNDTHKVKAYLPTYVYTMLKADAKKNNASMSSYIKLAILAFHDDNVLKNTRNTDNQKDIDYHDFVVQLTRIGTNLNQISRKCNQGFKIDNDLRDFIDDYSDKIDDLLEKMSNNVDY